MDFNKQAVSQTTSHHLPLLHQESQMRRLVPRAFRWIYMHAATLPLPKTAAAEFHLVVSERVTNILRTQGGGQLEFWSGSKLGFQSLSACAGSKAIILAAGISYFFCFWLRQGELQPQNSIFVSEATGGCRRLSACVTRMFHQPHRRQSRQSRQSRYVNITNPQYPNAFIPWPRKSQKIVNSWADSYHSLALHKPSSHKADPRWQLGASYPIWTKSSYTGNHSLVGQSLPPRP